jgi:hypothetical protein
LAGLLGLLLLSGLGLRLRMSSAAPGLDERGMRSRSPMVRRRLDTMLLSLNSTSRFAPSMRASWAWGRGGEHGQLYFIQ